MAKVLNEERFNPSRLPGLSLWIDAQATSTISSTASGVTSWSDRSGMGNTLNTSLTNTGPLVFTRQDGGFPKPTAFTCIASDATGTKLVACTNGEGVYISTDSGTTWFSTFLTPSLTYQSITSSADGTKIAVIASGATSGRLFVSSDSGSTWADKSVGLPLTYARSIVFSADGSTAAFVTGGSLTGKIYVSTDSGSTWVNKTTGLPTTANWFSITSSADGKKLAAVVSGGGIYTSIDSGNSWTLRSSGLPTTASWRIIASDSNGTNLVACSSTATDGGGIWKSTNSGVNWTKTPAITASWRSVASSADGIKLAAVEMTYGGVYTSSNSGDTWVLRTLGLPSTGNWTSITSSADGIKLAAVVSGGGGVYTSTDYGVNWTLTRGLPPIPLSFRYIASSSDGTKLAAVVVGGGIYTSTDYGLNWTKTSAITASWTSIASSADGIKLAAVEITTGKVYTSSNSGDTWILRTASLTSIPFWTSITSSADGTILAAVSGATGGALYISTDSGSSWTPRGPTGNWNSITSSANGINLAAVISSGGIYTSTDSGVSWVQRTSGLPATENWRSITSSANGSKLAVLVQQGGIYTSVNYGESWTKQTSGLPSGGTWFSITSSADGSKLAAAINGGGIYASTDSGVTWAQQMSAPSEKWSSLAYSADGTILAAVLTLGGIYTCYRPQYTFPVISNTAIISQPSVFFPPGAQMVSTLNSGLGAPTISGCVLWLDAADTTTYVGPTTSLTGWKDKSGSGYVATPLSGTITTATLNGTPVLEFSNNRMIIPNFTWNMSFTSIMVWKPTSGDQMIGLCASTATNATWYDYISTGNWALVYLNSATTSTDTNYIQGPTDQYPGSPARVVPVNQWFIFSIGYTEGTTTITNYAVNGSARTSSPVSPQTGTNTGVYFINGLANRAYGYSQVAEIMHFNRSLGSDERQTIEGYLATKWGLRANLPPTHPYSSVPYSGTFALNPSTPVSKSIFIAYQTPSLTSTMRFATGNDVSGGAFGFSQTQYYVSAPYQYDYGNTRWTTNTVLYTLPTVLSGIYDASAGIIRGDRNFNADSDVRESAMINIISNTPYSLGRSPISTSIVTSASFHLCEIIAYNRALATTDRQMIEGYMAWKWGITNQLPIGHPYKEFPPSGEQVIIPSTPANIMQGIISWLDMADTSSYTLSGTTLKTIRDKATTNGTFTISGKPNNFSFSRIGSLPALVFPGNNTSTVLDNTFLFRNVPVPSVGSTCMVLIPKSQFTASKLGVLGWGSPGNSLGNPGLGYNSPTTTIQTLQSYNTITNTFFGPSLNLAADTPTILFWAWYNGNMVYFSCNGTNLLTSTQGTTAYYNPASTNTQFYVGNDGGFGAQFTLGELVMYNQYGETPFRNLIEGHLAWKWGLQTNLPAYHPYYYSAPGLQSLTEVNALSQPSDILNLTMWLDAADTATLTLTPTTFTWTDKSAVANHVVSTTSGNIPALSTFGTARRPSVYFGPGKSATSIYNSGASTGQFSAFIVASVPDLSYILISTGQYTTTATTTPGQSFAFYASNGSTYGVCSPFVGGGGTKVAPYSTVRSQTAELFASLSGLTTSGNINFGSTVGGTCGTIPATPWVFGDCLGDPSPKSFHVHEFITYSRQLATNERWIIEGYLYWKWMNLI